MTQKQIQKEFAKGIEKIGQTVQKIDELADEATKQLAEITSITRQINIISQDDIVPLTLDMPDNQPDLVQDKPRRTRRSRKATDSTPEQETASDEDTPPEQGSASDEQQTDEALPS